MTPQPRAYYLEPKAARHADTFVPRRARVDDALRDLAVRYYRRNRWRGPIARSWRQHGRKQARSLL